MNQVMAISENGKSQGIKSSIWLQESVQDFFSCINWEMHPVEIQQLQQAPLDGSSELTSLTVTVAQFFSSIPWEGKPVIAPAIADSPTLEISEEETDDLTLDAFSDLF